MREMIRQNGDKSRWGNRMHVGAVGGAFPPYALVGLLSIFAVEAILFTGNEFVGRCFTPLQWTGLILFLDGVVKVRRGRSLISDHFGEFLLLAVISIGSWAVFEWYNVGLRNWTYVGLPDNMLGRYAGYAWAFATISPGMFLIYEVVESFVPGQDPYPYPRLPDTAFWAFVLFGLACLIVPIIWPSTWMTPLVWIGFAFLLDPINGRLGERSILTEFFTGHTRSMPLFFLAGLIAGLFWEFWNYWATTKWEYEVPYLGHLKLFEMPVLGFLGFMPFIVESFAIYTLVRRFIPIRREVRYLG